MEPCDFYKIVDIELGKIAASYYSSQGLPFEYFMDYIETLSFSDRVLFVGKHLVERSYPLDK